MKPSLPLKTKTVKKIPKLQINRQFRNKKVGKKVTKERNGTSMLIKKEKNSRSLGKERKTPIKMKTIKRLNKKEKKENGMKRIKKDQRILIDKKLRRK